MLSFFFNYLFIYFLLDLMAIQDGTGLVQSATQLPKLMLSPQHYSGSWGAGTSSLAPVHSAHAHGLVGQHVLSVRQFSKDQVRDIFFNVFFYE